MPEERLSIMPTVAALDFQWQPPLCICFSDIPDTGLVSAKHAEGVTLIAGHPDRWRQTFIKLELMGLGCFVPLLRPVNLDPEEGDSIDRSAEKIEIRKQFWSAVMQTMVPAKTPEVAD